MEEMIALMAGMKALICALVNLINLTSDRLFLPYF